MTARTATGWLEPRVVAEQLPLALGHRAASGRADFLVAPCNAEAVAWIDQYPDWHGGGVVLWGEAACGKSHLTEVWRDRSGGRIVAADEVAGLDPHAVVAAVPALAIEDVDGDGDGGGLGAAGETATFHLYNLLREQNKLMLLTGRAAPSRWPVGLADLRSRVLALPAVGIGLPDDETVRAVLAKLFDDRQLSVDEKVLSFAVSRMERSFAAAWRLVAAVDAASLARRQAVTVALVRQVLAEGAD